jgi:hypothetical protein
MFFNICPRLPAGTGRMLIGYVLSGSISGRSAVNRIRGSHADLRFLERDYSKNTAKLTDVSVVPKVDTPDAEAFQNEK